MKIKTLSKYKLGAIAATLLVSSSGGMVLANEGEGKIPTDVDTIPAYAKETILDMYANNKLAGFNDGSFQPHKELTRSEYLGMLLRAYDFGEDLDKKLSIEKGYVKFLNEEKMSNWEKSVLREAYIKGLANGTGSQDFFDEEENYVEVIDMKGSKEISREEMAAIFESAMNQSVVKNYTNSTNEEILGKFKDFDKISGWAVDSVANVVDFGLISGTSADTFSPKKIGTRVEAALLLNRLEGAINSNLEKIPSTLKIPIGLGNWEIMDILDNSGFEDISDVFLIVNPLSDNDDDLAKTGFNFNSDSTLKTTYVITYKDANGKGYVNAIHVESESTFKTVGEIRTIAEASAAEYGMTDVKVYAMLGMSNIVAEDSTPDADLLTNDETVVLIIDGGLNLLNEYKVTIE